ncbi:unnamed protein product [Lasius platythorax]|uniref:Uncharacterized protein n=1 Tax=Lasius platythorax TaxID=488582 RepID=A0AAV2N2S0_9HYME
MVDVIYQVELSGPQRYLREYLKGSRHIKVPGVTKSFFGGGTCRYRDDPLEILAFCQDMAGLTSLFCTTRYLRGVVTIVPVR